MRALATPFPTLIALSLPLAVAAQGYPVIADPMAPGVPPGGMIGAPAMGAPAVGAPLVGAPVPGAPYGGGAVVVQPGQPVQGGYIMTPQNSWGTGVVTPAWDNMSCAWPRWWVWWLKKCATSSAAGSSRSRPSLLT